MIKLRQEIEKKLNRAEAVYGDRSYYADIKNVDITKVKKLGYKVEKDGKQYKISS